MYTDATFSLSLTLSLFAGKEWRPDAENEQIFLMYPSEESQWYLLPGPLPVDFPDGSVVKESACRCRRHQRHGFNPWVGKIPWSRKQQPHSSIPAWKVPWTEEPGGLQFMGSQRGRQDEWLCTLSLPLQMVKFYKYSLPHEVCISCVFKLWLIMFKLRAYTLMSTWYNLTVALIVTKVMLPGIYWFPRSEISRGRGPGDKVLIPLLRLLPLVCPFSSLSCLFKMRNRHSPSHLRPFQVCRWWHGEAGSLVLGFIFQ